MLIELGVDRVLTSGQESSVLEGLDLITKLVERANGRIVVMPGCGITARNIAKISRQCGATELHVVANRQVESAMRYRNGRCFMGTQLQAPEYSRTVTSEQHLRTMLNALEG